ncbi:MAG: hypothetical protein RIE32_00010 [Phycisphaerales bacterium]
MARSAHNRRAAAIIAALGACVLPGCYARLAPSPDPGPQVWAGVLTGEDFLGRYEVYLDQRPDGAAFLSVAPGDNPHVTDAGPMPTCTVHHGRWFVEHDERGLERWVLEVEGWPTMTLRRNFYWTRYETHARFLEPQSPPAPCNDWGTVFALVSSDPARR